MTEKTHKPILAAVDFTEECRRSLVHASRLAKSRNRPLLILHVVHESAEQLGFYRSHDDGCQSLPLDYIAEKLLASFVAEVSAAEEAGKSLSAANLLVTSGLPANRILEVAEINGAEMIVLGALHKQTGRLKRLWTGAGGVAHYLQRHSSIPVSTPEGDIDLFRKRSSGDWQTGEATP